MLLPRIGALLFAVKAANAFKDASPFFMLSSSPLTSQQSNVATVDNVQQQILEEARECPYDLYIIVQQLGLRAADLQNADSMLKLRQRVASAKPENFMHINNVMGELDIGSLSETIARNCGAEEVSSWQLHPALDAAGAVDKKQVTSMQYASLSTDKSMRRKELAIYDEQLAGVLASIPDELSWILIYASTPASSNIVSLDPELYQMDEPYPSALHQDLKRDLSAQRRQSNGTDNPHSNLPLFEKYQFLTPGIFMGLTVSLLLLLILWTGVSAIAGLQVSYMAFNKEMGPQAQNKGKQQ